MYAHVVKRLAPKVVEAPQDAHQRVVGRLERDVVELVPAQRAEHRPPACDLEPRGAQEQRVQALQRVVPHRPGRPERLEPFVRVPVEGGTLFDGEGLGFHSPDGNTRVSTVTEE